MRQVLRFERKYLLPQQEYRRHRARLEQLLPKDAHYGAEGYKIRSLYFDTLWDSDYFEKTEGIELRRKIRLRLYDPAGDVAFLEMKQKQGEHQLKRSLKLSKAEAQALCCGEYSVLLDCHNNFADECYALLTMRGYRPKVIVEYNREAFTIPTNDTRITFDRDIRATEGSFDLFDPQLCLYPVIDQGQVVLEIKYNGFLIEYIRELAGSCDRAQTSASKYAMGRLASYGVV